jgi:hypothetical protein
MWVVHINRVHNVEGMYMYMSAAALGWVCGSMLRQQPCMNVFEQQTCRLLLCSSRSASSSEQHPQL